jgi:superkiller protein 3
LATLFQERTNESSRAVETLEKISSTIEADFESTESPESLAKFALAKTDLARTYLASGSYEEAIECGETALGLSSDEAENELSSEQRKQARLSAHLTVGLAQYYNNQFDKAIGYFESALEESDGNPDAVCLLAQVLWAEGSEESRDRAREKLFETIEQHPEHVQSVLLLGVIALLDNDEDSLEAVVEELYGLRTNHKVTASEQSNIGEVLRAIATLGEGRTEEDMKTQLQTDIMLHPNLPHGWAAMAQSTGDEYAAQMALKVAARGIPPKGLLDAQDLSKAYAGTATAGDAQRAAFLAPWEQNGWSSLAVATEGM